jgi:hypothetical protein
MQIEFRVYGHMIRNAHFYWPKLSHDTKWPFLLDEANFFTDIEYKLE